MNKRQWQVLALGTLATVLVPALGTPKPGPPSYIGPRVETAPGHYAQEFRTAWMPLWPLYMSLCLAGLTGAAIYKWRTKDAA